MEKAEFFSLARVGRGLDFLTKDQRNQVKIEKTAAQILAEQVTIDGEVMGESDPNTTLITVLHDKMNEVMVTAGCMTPSAVLAHNALILALKETKMVRSWILDDEN
jgi:hydroxyethylthiazole kinase-like sugar kinase family protein